MVNEILKRAHGTVYCLTPHPEFFQRLGFDVIPPADVPESLKPKMNRCELCFSGLEAMKLIKETREEKR